MKRCAPSHQDKDDPQYIGFLVVSHLVKNEIAGEGYSIYLDRRIESAITLVPLPSLPVIFSVLLYPYHYIFS